MEHDTLREKGFEAIAASLVDFGYSDCTGEMISDIHAAMVEGKEEIPHGIIGNFAADQLRSRPDLFGDLGKLFGDGDLEAHSNETAC